MLIKNISKQTRLNEKMITKWQDMHKNEGKCV